MNTEATMMAIRAYIESVVGDTWTPGDYHEGRRSVAETVKDIISEAEAAATGDTD